MKITLKKESMKELIKNIEKCLKNKSTFVVANTLEASTIDYVNIEMEEGESIFKEKDIIKQTHLLKKCKWFT